VNSSANSEFSNRIDLHISWYPQADWCGSESEQWDDYKGPIPRVGDELQAPLPIVVKTPQGVSWRVANVCWDPDTYNQGFDIYVDVEPRPTPTDIE